MVVARTLTSKPAFHGLRRFNATKDLGGVAHLLEEAFRPDHNFPFATVPLLREIGIALWTLNYAPGFPDATDGFVWIEDGKLVGNVTLTVDHKDNTCYYVSNVAVKNEYRRQGIARAMMQATIEHVRTLNGQRILLNVRPNNPGAVKLYVDLGFQSIATHGEWMIESIPPRLPQIDLTGLRKLRMSDERAISDLIRAAIPENVRRYRTERNEFELLWDEQIGEAIVDFFIGQSSQRWALERDGKLAALLFVRGRHIGAPHKIAIQVHPDYRGTLEGALVTYALQKLRQFPSRRICAEATSIHAELVNTLENYGFEFFKGLTLMELGL